MLNTGTANLSSQDPVDKGNKVVHNMTEIVQAAALPAQSRRKLLPVGGII